VAFEKIERWTIWTSGSSTGLSVSSLLLTMGINMIAVRAVTLLMPIDLAPGFVMHFKISFDLPRLS
jgi:hypothetical protein